MNPVSDDTRVRALDQLIGSARVDAEQLADAKASSCVSLEGVYAIDGLPAGVLPPDFLAGYRLQREIHRGGQGIVYHAVQLSTNQSVAIKVMRGGPLAGSSDEIRFKREVQILAELSHPQIVAIRDTGEAGSLRYFVMDYVSGVPLDAYVASLANQNPARLGRGSVVPGRQVRGSGSAHRRSRRAGEKTEIADLLRLFASVCDAVNAAHLRGVIHRDLKPSNILVVDRGTGIRDPGSGGHGAGSTSVPSSPIPDPSRAQPMILDFGLAKLVRDDSGADTITHEGQFVGSLPWASPEQAAGEQANIDLRTDVYSLGVILYQLLTGRFPYETQGGMKAVLERIQHAELIAPRKLGGGRPARHVGAVPDRDGRAGGVSDRDHLSGRIDDEIDTILRKCLAKDRERRYQTAGDLARDIERYLRGEAIEAKRDSAIYVAGKLIRKYRGFVAAVATVIVVAVAGGLTSTVLWQQAADERNAALAAVDEANFVKSCLDTVLTEIGLEKVGATGTVNACQVLTEVFARIEPRLAGRPKVECEVRRLVGSAFAARGCWPEADAQLASAVRVAREAFGRDHATIAYALNVSGGLRLAQRDYSGAESLFREALNMQRRLSVDDRAPEALTLASLSQCLLLSGDIIGAEQNLAEALRILDTTNPGGAAAVRRGFAEHLYDLGLYDKAEPLQREALAIARHRAAEDEIAHHLNSYGVLLRDLERLDEAEIMLRECVSIRRRICHEGEHSIRYLCASLSELGETLVRQGRFPEAELLLVETSEKWPPSFDVSILQFRCEALRRIVKLYELWDAAEPGMGYAEEAAHRRETLSETENTR